MFTRTATLFVTALLLTASASADLAGIEKPIETTSTTLSLPRSVPGSITVAPCEGCPSVLLQVTNETRLLIDSQSVSLAELREAAATPSQNVSIYYVPATRAITRIVVSSRK